MESVVVDIIEEVEEVSLHILGNASNIILRRSSVWFQNENPILKNGYIGIETDTQKVKIGDGNVWNEINYFGGSATITLTNTKILVGNASNEAAEVSLTLGPTAGSFSLSNTGVLTMPDANAITRGLLSPANFAQFNSKEPPITAGTNLQYLRGDKTFQTLNTSVVPEDTNLYFTNERVESVVNPLLALKSDLASPTFTGVATFQNIIRLTSASLGTAVAGNVEFLTDKYYGVITTGTSRKEFVLADTPLTSGRIIFTTTNGRAIDSSLLTFNGSTLVLPTGTSSASPLNIPVGVRATGGNILSGNIDREADKLYFTINTGLSQKEFALNDSAIPVTAIPYGTTNGRYTGNANMNADGTKMSIGAPISGGYNGSYGLYNARVNSRAFVVEQTAATGSAWNEMRGAPNVGQNGAMFRTLIYGWTGNGNYATGVNISLDSITRIDAASNWTVPATGVLLNSAATIYNLIGTITTNLGTKLDANGLRIDQNQNLNTANQTGVGLHLASGKFRFSSRQIGNAGLSSGDVYVDTAANILANGDYVVGMKA